MNNEIFEKIKKTVAEQLDIDEDSILETSNFTTDLHADSLALLDQYPADLVSLKNLVLISARMNPKILKLLKTQ